MPGVNIIVGDDGSNTLAGSAGPDLICEFDPNGPQIQVSSIAARIAKLPNIEKSSDGMNETSTFIWPSLVSNSVRIRFDIG